MKVQDSLWNQLVAYVVPGALLVAVGSQVPIWFCIACPVVLGLLAPFIFNAGDSIAVIYVQLCAHSLQIYYCIFPSGRYLPCVGSFLCWQLCTWCYTCLIVCSIFLWTRLAACCLTFTMLQAMAVPMRSRPMVENLYICKAWLESDSVFHIRQVTNLYVMQKRYLGYRFSIDFGPLISLVIVSRWTMFESQDIS